MSPFRKQVLHMPFRPARKVLPQVPSFDFTGGDLTILLSNPEDPETPTSTRACSNCLSIASPVWEKFLHPPWATDSTPPVTQVDFTSGDFATITLLLRIAHLQFQNIPKKLSYPRLLQMAIACDQYSCAGLVAPWLESWLSDERTSSMEDGKEGWLFIAWVFGRHSIFEQLANKLVLEVKTNDEGEFLTKNGEVMPEPMPHNILESILEVRAETIDRLFFIPFTWLKNFEQSPTPLCSRTYDREACDAIMYGSVARAIQHASLWPLTTSDKIHLSIAEFVNVLRSVRVYPLHEPRGKSMEWSHVNCKTFNMHFGIATILREIGNPVMDCHRVHMKQQRGEVEEN
ncbi:hypothetical protein V8E51_015619 [Hyaloscypha variabilis]